MRQHRKSFFNWRNLLLVAIFCCFCGPVVAQQTAHGAPSLYSKGKINAVNQIEVFYDFQCPSCAVFHETLMKVLERRGDAVLVTVRHFPLSTIHDKALDAALTAEAAGIQGKFWEMSSLLFKKQKIWSNSLNYKRTFIKYAKSLELDMEQFERDLSNSNTLDRVNLDVARARFLDLNSVPTVFLNGRQLEWADTTRLEEIISKGN